MKISNLSYLKIFILISLSIITFFTYKSFEKIKIEARERENLIINLKKCLDLDNKIKRRISVSINLVEYCVQKHGSLEK